MALKPTAHINHPDAENGRYRREPGTCISPGTLQDTVVTGREVSVEI